MSRIRKCLVAVLITALLLMGVGGLTGCGKTEKTSTTTTLESSNNPSFYGDVVFFIATVNTANGRIAEGRDERPIVTFYDGATLLASISQMSGLGQFTCDISVLAVGSHDIIAVYEGSSFHTGSTSEPLTQLVSQASNVAYDWEWQSPLPQGYSLESVWGSSSSDVFAVGWRGTILHYDGSTWSGMDSGTGRDLYGVWGSSSANVFAVGYSGTILRYNGSTWSPMISGTSEENLNCVWGSSSSDVFAVGQNGVILHYDGSTWSAVSSGTTYYLDGVWGSSSSDVFAVGQNGVILHYDGDTWSATSGAGRALLHGVWGTGHSDVFAVGQYGVILHYDGDTWSAMSSGASEDLQCVWGTAWNDVFAVGWGRPPLRLDGNGTILHYAG